MPSWLRAARARRVLGHPEDHKGPYPQMPNAVWHFHVESTHPKGKALAKAVQGFRTYIENNGNVIPNYGKRYRCGEVIATGFVESTVNQVVSKRFCKKQHMQWSKRGAHLLLQTRVKTLNGELGSVFKRWYLDLQLEKETQAACPPASPCSPPLRHDQAPASGNRLCSVRRTGTSSGGWRWGSRRSGAPAARPGGSQGTRRDGTPGGTRHHGASRQERHEVLCPPP